MTRTYKWLSGWLMVFTLIATACGSTTPAATSSDVTSAPVAAVATTAPAATSLFDEMVMLRQIAAWRLARS